MDCLDLLIADHNRFRGTFARFQEAHEADDVATMASLASRLFQDLEIHTAIEEEIFYPAIHDLSEEIGETVDEGLQGAPRGRRAGRGDQGAAAGRPTTGTPR